MHIYVYVYIIMQMYVYIHISIYRHLQYIIGATDPCSQDVSSIALVITPKCRSKPQAQSCHKPLNKLYKPYNKIFQILNPWFCELTLSKTLRL